MNVLGIETTCDDTGAAVVRSGREILSNVVSSQIAMHQEHGGVVPELAAREHLRAIIPVVRTALEESGLTPAEIDAIAVATGPGLAAALLVGANVAKTLAYVYDRPLVSINHLEAHIYATWLSDRSEPSVPEPEFPLLCLLVSGGHTELLLMHQHGVFEQLGATLDDAAGEAFDKGARLLGLPYPGGPSIQRAAAGGDPSRHPLPRAWLPDSNDFSFSGLKTALLRATQPYRLPDAPPAIRQPDAPFAAHRPPRYRDDLPLADLAAAFQEAIVEVLAVKTARAAHARRVRGVVLAGGVAANVALREWMVRALESEFGTDPPPLQVPPVRLCTDNAAMVAAAGYHALRRGYQAGWELDISARMPLPTSTVRLDGPAWTSL